MRKGRGLMGKDLGKTEKKRIQEKLNTKREYGVGRTLLSILGGKGLY